MKLTKEMLTEMIKEQMEEIAPDPQTKYFGMSKGQQKDKIKRKYQAALWKLDLVIYLLDQIGEISVKDPFISNVSNELSKIRNHMMRNLGKY